jgi:colanic acid/amylovoran biosynthesis glycosyltransferase
MRLAYLINQYPKASHTFIRREILAIEAKGVPVHRFALRGWAEIAPDPQDRAEMLRTEYLLQKGIWPLIVAGVSVALGSPQRMFRAFKLVVKSARGAPRPLPVQIAYLLEAALLSSRCKTLGITHLHAHFGTNAAQIAALCMVLGGPRFSFTVHGPEEFDHPTGLHLDLKIALASKVIAITSYCRSQLMRWVKRQEWEKIAVVRCGLDVQFLGASAPALEVNSVGASTFVCVGRLCEQKGQQLLLRAFASVVQRYPFATLVLAGDGEDRPLLEEMIAQYGLRQQVQITGWIDSAKVRELLTDARCLVLPSFAEGLPIVLMEAMALSRPVITTYVAGIPELVVPGESGWLIPAGSETRLVEAMVQCLECDLGKLNRMGNQGRIAVLENHDMNANAEALLAVFYSAQNSRPDAA